jgi:fibronectin type 3 domain-containing protein
LAASTIAAPTGLTATGVSKSQINLKWTAVTGTTKYNIYRATSQTGTYSYVGSSTTNAYSNASLGANTTYWYKVSAVDSTGEGSQTTAVSTKTLL